MVDYNYPVSDYGTTSFESLYGGGISSLDPSFGNFAGYRMSGTTIGFSPNPTTANQLNETITAAKTGAKSFEVSLLGINDQDQTIPIQHFAEMRALMKLSGIKPTMHGPLIDPAGFGNQGWGGDITREDNEERMFHALEKGYKLDPKGNIAVVFHAPNGAPGRDYTPNKDVKPGHKERFKIEKSLAIDQETGQMVPIEEEMKFRPDRPEFLDKEAKKGQIYSALDHVNSINETQWDQRQTELATFNKHAEEIIGGSDLYFQDIPNAYIKDIKNKQGQLIDQQIIDPNTNQEIQLTPNQHAALGRLNKADIFLENIEQNFNTNFQRAFKYGSETQREELKKLAENYSKDVKELEKGPYKLLTPLYKKEILDKSIHGLWNITKLREDLKNPGKPDPNYGSPKVFMEVEDFAKEKAAETFGNLATRAYDKFGKYAPILAVENLFQGMAFSKASDMKDLIYKSRKNFEENLIKRGLDKEEAKQVASKQIGINWDVGHLNMMRKKGFTTKDIIEETKQIAKDPSLLKHMHLTDNFGFADSHIPLGAGNVPLKEIMQELEKTGRLHEVSKIGEFGGFTQHFGRTAHHLALGTFGSSIYGMKAAPGWNQAIGIAGGYFSGYGEINPPIHHSIYGSGFSTIPITLGGQISGDQSRFGGTPMA